MTKLQLSTKAQTLENLRPWLSSASVLELYYFNVNEFLNDPQGVSENLCSLFVDENLIVRSSSAREDTYARSNAGVFRTIANVTNSPENLKAAIAEVIASYGDIVTGDEVLVQPMLSEIALSGVAFTADIDTLAPYYVVNYDETGRTDGVTSGDSDETVTYVCSKCAPVVCEDERIAKVIRACKECEQLFDYPYLDIEFAVTQHGECIIFQVRPIAHRNKDDLSSVEVDVALSRIHRKLKKIMSPHPYLLGEAGIYGVMPDWNPAEIIGMRPRRLALSLYKELITDSIWAYQRNNYGYRNLRSHPLLVSFMGIPYVDVRVSFNSFIPKGLNQRIAARLVNYYLDRLRSSPNFHDKVEFEIVFSCYYLDLPKQLRVLLEYGLSESDIECVKLALLELTNSVINNENGLFRRDVERIKTLESRYQTIAASDFGGIEKIHWLIEDCKRYGTLPFAGLARSAFIAVQFLRSFVSTGIISNRDYDAFMNSLNTVSKQLVRDLGRLANRELSKCDFLRHYGHLRPGTYDILSLRYDEDFDGYFSGGANEHQQQLSFSFSREQELKIERALAKNGIQASFRELIAFITESIEAREFSKFAFTRSLSEVLRLVQALGEKFEVSRDDISHLDIHRVLEMYASLGDQDVRDVLLEDIKTNKKLFDTSRALRLPKLLVNPKDVYAFRLDVDEPTFVTTKRIEAHIVRENEFKNVELEDKIPFIRSADPGYDFLFTKSISGLVTQYGGANSHMAIRCAELGIPAVIGAGERNFDAWGDAKVLELDCTNKLVRVIT